MDSIRESMSLNRYSPPLLNSKGIRAKASAEEPQVRRIRTRRYTELIELARKLLTGNKSNCVAPRRGRFSNFGRIGGILEPSQKRRKLLKSGEDLASASH
jgi:hypothetical protein